MVRRHTYQMARTRNFRARSERIETGELVKSKREECQRGTENGRVISGEQLDSVQEETLAVLATGTIVVSKHSRLLLLRRRRHWLTGESPRQAVILARRSYWKERSKSVQKFPQRKLHKSVVWWHPPVGQNYTSDSGCKFGDKCLYTEADRQPSTKSKKSGGEGLVAFGEGVWTIGFCFPRYRPTEEFSSTEERKIGIKLHRQRLQGHVKIRERKGPSQGFVQKREPRERDPCAPKFWRKGPSGHRAEKHGIWRMFINPCVNHRPKLGWCRHPLRNQSEEWDFRGILEHRCTCPAKKVLSWAELEPFENPGSPQRWLLPMEKWKQVREAQENVHDFDFFVTENPRRRMQSVIGQAPRRTRSHLRATQPSKSSIWPRMGKFCAIRNILFLLFFQGWSSSSSASSSSTLLPQDSSRTSTSKTTKWRYSRSSFGKTEAILQKSKNNSKNVATIK